MKIQSLLLVLISGSNYECSTRPNLVTAVAKSAVALNLKSETSKYEDKIIQQRNNVSSRSQEAFSGRTTNINTQYQEF